MEFEENDGEIERKSHATFAAHFFYTGLLPEIVLLNRSVNRIGKERLLIRYPLGVQTVLLN